MIRRFLMWLTARLPAKRIGRDEPYVEWYYICTLPILGGVRVQLHRFLRSDPDGLHDHPWGWARTFILRGWYIEERRDRTRVRKAWRTYGLTGDTFHRVHLPVGARECWTLFFHGPYVKHWGFITPRSDSWADWSTREGGLWLYRARPRHHARFDDWHKTAPLGREIREAA